MATPPALSTPTSEFMPKFTPGGAFRSGLGHGQEAMPAMAAEASEVAMQAQGHPASLLQLQLPPLPLLPPQAEHLTQMPMHGHPGRGLALNRRLTHRRLPWKTQRGVPPQRAQSLRHFCW